MTCPKSADEICKEIPCRSAAASSDGLRNSVVALPTSPRWNADSDGDAYGNTDGNAIGNTDSDTNGNAERNPESDTTTAPDTVSAPNTIAKGCNPFCGDSRNTLASSSKGDERGGCAGSRACCDNLDLQATRLPLQVSATEQ